MPPKFPACDPCRASKLACDHTQPVCSRCRDRNQAAACAYRSQPFKKRKVEDISTDPSPSQQKTPIYSLRPKSLARPLAKSRRYPNPGYLGSSSHTTFFEHLSSGSSSEIEEKDQATGRGLNKAFDYVVNDEKVSHGAMLITQICSVKGSSWISLVKAWVASGVNLALVGPFTIQCAEAAQYLFESPSESEKDIEETSRNLFSHSCSPLVTGADVTMEEFCARFCRERVRWETLGLFFTAVSRATLDVPFFETLYDSDHDRRNLQRLAMHYSDLCLEIAISLDCLNDLQLLLQYENFISHAQIEGDQSYQSWRKLGDVVSSLFALGYHENVGNAKNVPAFLIELRQGAFERAYSADKNISIFMGRPPRLHRKYCRIVRRRVEWAPNESFTYLADTRWSAVLAVLKEDILDLFREENHDDRIRKARAIQADAEEQWATLPPQFRLEGHLRSYGDRRPIEKDFMVSARLNYLHVGLLLHLALVRRVSEPDVRLLAISAEMLSLIVEAVVLKDRLANSGTSLGWKVVYYGLAAAGIISLALLNKSFTTGSEGASPSKAIRDLSVLVAQVETGALVNLEDPNYALLSGAAQTIKNLLDRLLSNEFIKKPNTQPAPDPLSLSPTDYIEEDWEHWQGQVLQDFEADFWLNLAEHPFLVGPENDVQGLS